MDDNKVNEDGIPHTILNQLNPQHNFFPGIYVPDDLGQPYNNQQTLIDLFKQGAGTGMFPMNTATDKTIMINTLTDEVNNLKKAHDRKAECLHMLTDIFFNKQKGLTFEECQNILGMIHSLDEENLVLAEIILKDKSYGSRKQTQP